MDAPAGGRFVPVVAVGLVWLAAAIGVGASGVLEPLPRPALQACIVGLTAMLCLWSFGTRAGRAWAKGVPLRGLMAIHLTRFVGLYFLWLYQRGRLPYDFAVPGGIGDVAVATVALGLIAAGPEKRGLYPILVIWNAMGLADILFVVGTAAKLGFRDQASIAELAHLPLSLLVTFVVPLIIWSHVMIIWWLRTTARPSPPSA